jgi:hypothetical protein
LEFLSPELGAAAESLRVDTEFIGGLRGRTIPELESQLSTYAGGMPGVGEAGIDTPAEVYRRDVVANALNAANRAKEVATAEALESAAPDLSRIETAAQVVDSVMQSPTPNPLVAEEAMRVLMDSYRALPEEIITEDMRESMAEVQQTMEALQSWRENQPEENAAELERLRSAIPSAQNLPEGVELIDQMAFNQRQANLLSGFMTAQRDALADGNVLAYAQSQTVMIEDPATGQPRVVGQPINLAGDPASVRASLNQRFREIDYLEERFSAVGQSVLLPQEVAVIERALTEGQPGQRALILGTIADQGADRAEKIFLSLDMKNPEMRVYSHIGSLMTSGNQQAAVLALRGMEVEKPPALKDADVSREFRAIVGEALAQLPYTAEAVRTTAGFIYAGYAAQDSSLNEMIKGSAWENAVMMAMGDLNIATINGNSVLMEPGVDVDLVDEWLDNPTPIDGVIYSTPGSMNLNVLKDGRWYPVAVGQDQYQLRTGSGYNSQPWTDSNGEPILISLSKLSSILGRPEGGNDR